MRLVGNQMLVGKEIRWYGKIGKGEFVSAHTQAIKSIYKKLILIFALLSQGEKEKIVYAI